MREETPQGSRRKPGAAGSHAQQAEKSRKKQNKEEVEQMTKEFAAIEDAKKRVVKYCELISDFTREELKQIQPWEQAMNDAQRVTQQLVQPGESAVDLFLSSILQQQQQNVSSSSIHQQESLPLPFGSTTSLFNQLFSNSINDGDKVLPLLSRTVVIPCHIQGFANSWIGLSVRCTVIPPTILAESHTTKELLEMERSQQVRELQSLRQKEIENQVAQQIASTMENNNNNNKQKPRTPRGGSGENNNTNRPGTSEQQQQQSSEEELLMIKKGRTQRRLNL